MLGAAAPLSSASLEFAAASSARTSTQLSRGIRNVSFCFRPVLFAQSPTISSSHAAILTPSRTFHQWLATSRRRSARTRLALALSSIITRCRKHWVVRHLRFFCFSAAAGTALSFSTFCASTNSRFKLLSAAESKASDDRLRLLRICVTHWAFTFVPLCRVTFAHSKLAANHRTSLILHRWSAATRRLGCRRATTSQAVAMATRRSVRAP